MAPSRWKNPSVTAPAVDGAFSPLRETLGLDARELTPLLVRRITATGAETRSFHRAAIVMKNVGDSGVSAKTIERVVHDVGQELAERRDADPEADDALARRPESHPNWRSSSAMAVGSAPASRGTAPACIAPPRAGGRPRTPA